MTSVNSASAYAALLLRLSLGVMYLTHSIVLKWMTYGLDGSAKFFESIGLPGPLAYVVVFTEIIGGSLLVIGVQSRWVALALTPILAGAVWTHFGNGWVFTAAGGGWEYPFYLIVLSIVQAVLGDGAYALKPSQPLAFDDARPALSHG